jgi:hypothetical protein
MRTFTILERGITTYWALAHGACNSWEFRKGCIHGDRNNREFQTGRSQHHGVMKMAVERFWELRTWRSQQFRSLEHGPRTPIGLFWAEIWAPHGPRWAQACLRAIMGQPLAIHGP